MDEPKYYQPLREYFGKEDIPWDRLPEIRVMHDQWCGMFSGKDCDCNPEVRSREEVERQFPETTHAR